MLLHKNFEFNLENFRKQVVIVKILTNRCYYIKIMVIKQFSKIS